MNIPNAPSEWNEIPKVKWSEEWALFCRPSIADEHWQRRLTQWWIHVSALAIIKEGLSAASKPDSLVPWHDARADILFSHLGVLDTKYGFLLTFNSLLFLVPGLSATIVIEAVRDQWDKVPPPAVGFLSLVSAVFLLLWFFTTWLSLNGLRDVVWGDLGFGGRSLKRILEQRSIPAESKPLEMLLTAKGALQNAEEEYAHDLMIAVVKRSNKYRVAIRFIKVNLGVTALFALVCLGLIAGFHR